MPIVDQHFLNPFEKWLRYGRFPWHFLVHLVLLLLVTTEALHYFHRDIRHVSRTTRHFRYLFIGDKYDERTHSAELHSPKEMQIAVDRTIGNHFAINEVSIVNYALEDEELLHIDARWRDGAVHTVQVRRSLFMNKTHGGQKYLKKQMPFLYSTRDLPRLAFLSFGHSFQENGGYYTQCFYRWRARTTFDGAEAGVFKMQLGGEARDCQAKVWQYSHALNLSILGLCAVSLCLLARKFFRVWRTIRRLRASPEAWGSLTGADVASLLSPWWLIMLVMHFAQLRACLVCQQVEPEIGQRFSCIGLSCFLTWLNICQYFESFPGFYYAFHTLYESALGVLRFITSVVPVFFAFALFGVCLLWQSPLFATPSAAFCALFSLMNGDMLHDTFSEAYAVAGPIGHLYIYVFLFLFIFVILNTNLSIVTDAYEKTKSHPQRESRRVQRQLANVASGQQIPQPQPGSASGASSPLEPRSPELRASVPEASRGSGGAAAAVSGVQQRSATAPLPMPVPTSHRPTMARRMSTGLPELAYMNPRYFHANKRMVEALLKVFPERPQPWSPRQDGHADGAGILRPPPLCGALDSPLMTATGSTTFASSADQRGGSRAPAMELTVRSRPGEELRSWLRALQDAASGLRCAASGDSELLGVLARLQEAIDAAADTVGARERTEPSEFFLPPSPH